MKTQKDKLIFKVTIDNDFNEIKGIRFKIIALLVMLIEKLSYTEIDITIEQIK